MTISDHLGPREDVIDALRAELLGPAPAGKSLDRESFDNWEEARGPWVDPESGEEILDRAPLGAVRRRRPVPRREHRAAHGRGSHGRCRSRGR
ncbi:hypothetical protein SGLAM104S_00050 [Streptomyces glaucescens]